MPLLVAGVGQSVSLQGTLYHEARDCSRCSRDTTAAQSQKVSVQEVASCWIFRVACHRLWSQYVVRDFLDAMAEAGFRRATVSQGSSPLLRHAAMLGTGGLDCELQRCSSAAWVFAGFSAGFQAGCLLPAGACQETKIRLERRETAAGHSCHS